MSTSKELTQTRLKQVLHYDPVSGLFTRLEAPGNRSDLVGTVAGSANRFGYIRISVDSRSYLAHRLAVLFMTGDWPADVVDHINAERGDNRWVNLRPASQSQNITNSGSRREHIPKNVYRDGRRWAVRFNLNGRMKSFGRYASIIEASEAATRIREELHGEFANHN